MSRIDDLIKQYCPDGVEYTTLGRICTLSRGRVMSKDYLRNNAGEYPVYSSQTENNGVFGKIKTYDQDGSFITWTTGGANAGSIFYHDNQKFSTTPDCGLISNNSPEKIHLKFLYYILSVTAKNYVYKGMGNPKLGISVISTIKVPVSPLELQEEIVKILDTFTELESELKAELEARKKQYTHYHYELLNFDLSTDWFELYTLVDFKNGKGHEKNIDASGNYIVVNSKFISTEGKVRKYSDSQLSPIYKDNILMVMSDLPNGKALAKCFLVDEDKKYTLNQRICSFIVKNNTVILVKYLFYILDRNKQLLRYDNRSDQTNLCKNDILSIKIPLPPLEVQERIVAILDKFDALVNGISSGLPAEITARRQQYTYYRDKLLTFKETL